MPKFSRELNFSPSEINDLVKYNQESGIFYWRPRSPDSFRDYGCYKRWRTLYENKEAFLSDNGQGYRRGYIRGVCLLAHRVAYCIMEGEWPDDEIDHINGIRSDNRWANLRKVTLAENSKNRRMSKNNTSGCNGVIWVKHAKKYQAIGFDQGKPLSLGYYKTLEEAEKVRKEWERENGYHENHGKLI